MLHRMRSCLLILFVVTACSTTTRVPPADGQIATVLDAWHAAAARADENAYFQHFAPEGIFLGTDATERWTVAAFREYAHPHFARGKAWTMRATRRAITVSQEGRIAWFDEDLVSDGLGAVRGSGVLVRSDASSPWLIAQYNLAITIPNDRFAAVKLLLEGRSPGPTPSS